MDRSRKPFHQSIVDAIERAKTAAEMNTLGQLILETGVPKEQDNVAAAWRDKLDLLGLSDDLGVAADVLSQKPTEAVGNDAEAPQTAAIAA